jgi:hypothetical protein
MKFSRIGRRLWRRPSPKLSCGAKDRDLEEVACEGVYWIHLPQDTVQWWDLVKTVMNHRVP